MLAVGITSDEFVELLCRKGKNRHFDGVDASSRYRGSRVYGEDSGGLGGAEVEALLIFLSVPVGLGPFREEAENDRFSFDSTSLTVT